MTILQLLATTDSLVIADLTADPGTGTSVAKFDNRPTWDNVGTSFDNRPTWDNKTSK